MTKPKDLARRLSPWTVPPAVQDWALSLLARYSSLAEHRRSRRSTSPNAVLAGRHRGQRCFILGTGPSINAQDLSPLSEEICLGLSNFIAHEQIEQIAPNYYCNVPIHGPHSDESAVAWLSEIEAKASGSTMFLGVQDRDLVERNGLFTRQPVHYLSYFRRNAGRSFRINMSDLTRPLPHAQSVGLIALSVAIYLGFDEIYLLGYDHSWPAHIGSSQHFYSEDQKVLGPDDWSVVDDIESYFLRFAGLMWRYKAIQAHAISRDIAIFNATPSSYLDVFPRVRVEELF